LQISIVNLQISENKCSLEISVIKFRYLLLGLYYRLDICKTFTDICNLFADISEIQVLQCMAAVFTFNPYLQRYANIISNLFRPTEQISVNPRHFDEIREIELQISQIDLQISVNKLDITFAYCKYGYIITACHRRRAISFCWQLGMAVM